LIINQALYIGEDLQTTMINPNQLWYNGIIVDDCPKHLAPDPSVATHSIFIPKHNHLVSFIPCDEKLGPRCIGQLHARYRYTLQYT
jgi:hypothetical protein